MKRWQVLVIAVVFSLMTVSCSDSENETEKEAEKEAKEGTPTIQLAQKLIDGYWLMESWGTQQEPGKPLAIPIEDINSTVYYFKDKKYTKIRVYYGTPYRIPLDEEGLDDSYTIEGNRLLLHDGESSFGPEERLLMMDVMAIDQSKFRAKLLYPIDEIKAYSIVDFRRISEQDLQSLLEKVGTLGERFPPPPPGDIAVAYDEPVEEYPDLNEDRPLPSNFELKDIEFVSQGDLDPNALDIPASEYFRSGMLLHIPAEINLELDENEHFGDELAYDLYAVFLNGAKGGKRNDPILGNAPYCFLEHGEYGYYHEVDEKPESDKMGPTHLLITSVRSKRKVGNGKDTLQLKLPKHIS